MPHRDQSIVGASAPGAAEVKRCRFAAPPPLPGLMRAPGRQRCTAEAPVACVSCAVLRRLPGENGRLELLSSVLRTTPIIPADLAN